MAELYTPGMVPQDYSPEFIREELERISISLMELESPQVILSPQNAEPTKRKEGLVVNADGTNWNPGAGAGLYEYIGGAWSKL